MDQKVEGVRLGEFSFMLGDLAFYADCKNPVF